MPDADGLRCEPIRDDDGTVLGIARVSGPLTERDQAALRDLVDAVRRRMDEDDDPEAAERQAAAIARVRRRAGRGGDAG